MGLYINRLFTLILFFIFGISSALLSFHGSDFPDISQSEEKSIIVISDTQSPIWAEEIFLESNKNERAREILFDHIAKARPDAIFHLGDLVSLGFSDNSWSAVDQFLNNLSKIQIPFYPTLGNHELMIFSSEGESNFIIRFPFYSKTGYLKIIGPIAFILLNSNISELSDDEIHKQQNWYKNQLATCQSDSAIKAIIVGCHHPPFTNSRIVNSNKDVQKYFIPDFINTEKCKLFLSGHSHSFEHFFQSGKDFLVIGGGGGLQHPLYQGQESIYRDIYKGSMNKRIFHYLKCQIDDSGMLVQINMLNSDISDIESVYEIEYNFYDNFIVEHQN